jgi:hypothetical protein
MNKRWMITLAAILFTFLLGVLSLQYAQDVPSGADKPERLRQQFAMGLLRTINTAEAIDQTKYGSYSSWQTLLEHYQNFDDFTAQHRREIANAHFADPPEVLPGWSLRLNVHVDGKGYDVLLLDMTDEKCGYAVVSDESVVIRQSKAFPCPI